MDEREASEQLQTIRTLMERAALYRRALGPTLVGIGLLGASAGVSGVLGVAGTDLRHFILYWTSVAFLAVLWAGFRVRHQAVTASEPFWTPPTRRVLSAMTPPIAVALAVTGAELLGGAPIPPATLASIWMVLYGLGLLAAGHFTLRGIRLLGWGFVAAGLLTVLSEPLRPHAPLGIREAHLLMALTFGLGHLVAGGRLLWLEKTGSE